MILHVDISLEDDGPVTTANDTGGKTMFQGFNEDTMRYFRGIGEENSRASFRKYAEQYENGVKTPLYELYYELSNFIKRLDDDIVCREGRCMSSPYNDARFCQNAPIKEYMYLRFKLLKGEKENVPGFFFDASEQRVRYGLRIYDLNGAGMEKLRCALLADRRKSAALLEALKRNAQIAVVGDFYKRDHYEKEPPELKEILNRKRVEFICENPVTPLFFERELLQEITVCWESLSDMYGLLKRALG